MSDLLLILLPGTMYFWVLFVGQGPLQEVFLEKETRILPRILSGPVLPIHYLLSKLLRSFVLCGLAIVLLLIASAVAFGIRWGNPFSLAAVTVVWALSMTGLVALIFSAARTREQASVLAPLVLLVLAMLGGSMFPYESLPKFLQMIGQYTPNRWAVLTLQGVAKSKPLVELVPPLLALLAIGVGGSVLALAVFNRRLTRG